MVHFSKFHLPLFSNFELWHRYKSLLPSAKGLSIYFYAESSPSHISTKPESNIVIPMHHDNWCCMLAWLDILYHELQCLVAAWTLEVLCIYVLRSQKGLARCHYCHITSWLFWQSVGIWDILLLFTSWLCHWYEWI